MHICIAAHLSAVTSHFNDGYHDGYMDKGRRFVEEKQCFSAVMVAAAKDDSKTESLWKISFRQTAAKKKPQSDRSRLYFVGTGGMSRVSDNER